MDYFKILNLAKEPFSNSPEPEFFYQSPKHVSCLQKLELAIRLRRGLNVVLGRVGTGKTTLCRHLISKFAEPDGTADDVETHLLLDPSFSTPLEFLSTVALDFGILGKSKKRKASPGGELSEWQLKESIKDDLFRKGVEEKKTVVLIIDEGQKLPDFGLEILREFLNYETNENKLLQIIIFGQPEFQQILDRLENVADRVNLLYILEPLNFQETRDMIRFRLDQAAGESPPPALFSRSGLLAVYLATGGYPRKIITLCHHVILAMIIQNHSRAGWFLVQSCAARLAAAGKTWPSRVLRWAPAALLASAAALVFLVAQPLTTSPVKAPPGTPADETSRKASSVAESAAPKSRVLPDEVRETPLIPAVVPEAHPVSDSVAKTQDSGNAALPSPGSRDADRHEKPKMLGKLALQNGRTVWWMLTDLYGEYNRDILRSVAKANPHIRNLNRVQAGQVVRLPALPAAKSPLKESGYWIEIASSPDLDETYELYRSHKTTFPFLRFVPYWNPRQGMLFTVLWKDGFPDETSARQNLAGLPAALAANAGVVKTPGPDTVYYSR